MKSVMWVLGAAAVSAVAVAVLGAQQIVLPGQPHAEFGDSITPAFEGWYDLPDGSHNFLFGYYNRNSKQIVDIPIGPNNSVEPGGPDHGQPTHFLTGRNWGLYAINVPKTYTLQDKPFVWAITANGQQVQIPTDFKPEYNIDVFSDAEHNTPPVIKFDERGQTVQGPINSAFEKTATVGKPLDLPVWATDDNIYTSGSNAPRSRMGDPVRFTWTMYRGPAEATFAKAEPKFDVTSGGAALGQSVSGKGNTTVTFPEAGDYWLQIVANDYSGPGGSGSGAAGCCWTNALLKVKVTQ
jgi:hypothetical protein